MNKLTSTSAIRVTEGQGTVISSDITGSVVISEYTTLVDIVAPNTTAKQIALGGLTICDYVYIEADGDFSLQLNANDTDVIEVKSYGESGGNKYAKFELFGSSITGLFVTNANDTNPVRMKFIFAQNQ